jgi:hypothetical protein
MPFSIDGIILRFPGGEAGVIRQHQLARDMSDEGGDAMIADLRIEREGQPDLQGKLRFTSEAFLRFPGKDDAEKFYAADSPHKRPVAGCLGLPAQHRIRYRTPLASETEKADAGDRYGDIFVDTEKSHEAYKEWLAMTRPAPGPGGRRRPLWFDRPLRPVAEAYKLSPGSRRV